MNHLTPHSAFMDGGSQSTPSDTSSTTLGVWSPFSVTAVKNGTLLSPEVQVPKSNDDQIKKRGRKGHTKSRTGCFNCKKSRIKCKENRPSCDYCSHRGLKCEWPDIQITQMGTLIRKPIPEIKVLTENPQPILPVFTIQDFRLFHHFIQSAYPHHPLGNASVWKHEIPCLASDYDFLLHSILGLAATDIASSRDDRDLRVTGMTHRVKAIESLNNAISGGIRCFEQGNAMLATCFTLLFQSVHMNDALPEYMSFMRGILAVAAHMGTRQMKFVFTKFLGDGQLEQIDPALHAVPLINPDVVTSACRSLEKIAPLCKTKVEIGFYTLLLRMARNLFTSSRDAYMELRKIYEMFSYTMPHEDFREFTDPNNEVCQLLQTHFVAMQLIMAPISKVERLEENAEQGKVQEQNEGGKTDAWLMSLHEKIPPHLRDFYEWTLWVENMCKAGKLFNGEV